MRVVCLSGGWLWKWKPPNDPGTHYPQAMQLLISRRPVERHSQQLNHQKAKKPVICDTIPNVFAPVDDTILDLSYMQCQLCIGYLGPIISIPCTEGELIYRAIVTIKLVASPVLAHLTITLQNSGYIRH